MKGMNRMVATLFLVAVLQIPARADTVEGMIANLAREMSIVQALGQREIELRRKVEAEARIWAQLRDFDAFHVATLRRIDRDVARYNAAKAKMEDAVGRDLDRLTELEAWVEGVVGGALAENVSTANLVSLMDQLELRRRDDNVCGQSEAYTLYLEMESAALVFLDLEEEYRSRIDELRLPAEYRELIDAARATAKELGDYGAAVRKDLTGFAYVLEPPRICDAVANLGRVLDLRYLVAEAAEAGEDLSAIRFDLARVLAEVTGEQQAIALAGAARRAIFRQSGLFSAHLTNNRAGEAARVADGIAGVAALLLGNLERSPFRESSQVQSARTEILAEVAAVEARAHSGLGDLETLKGMIFLRAGSLRARLFAVERSVPAPAVWSALKDRIRLETGVGPEGTIAYPALDDRNAVLAYDARLASAERALADSGLEGR